MNYFSNWPNTSKEILQGVSGRSLFVCLLFCFPFTCLFLCLFFDDINDNETKKWSSHLTFEFIQLQRTLSAGHSVSYPAIATQTVVSSDHRHNCLDTFAPYTNLLCCISIGKNNCHDFCWISLSSEIYNIVNLNFSLLSMSNFQLWPYVI